MSNSKKSNNTSYLGWLILLMIFAFPMLGIVYAVDFVDSNISIAIRVLLTICFLAMALALLVKSRTNEKEVENTAKYISEFSKGLAKAGFMGAVSIAFILAIWFATPLFMKAIDNEAKKLCQSSVNQTSFEKVACKL